MKITIDAIDDAYFFLADKSEAFGCTYHKDEQEFRFINRLENGEVNLFNNRTHTILNIDGKFFDENFDIVGHPIYIGHLTQIIGHRIEEIYPVVTQEEFLRYVNLGKFIVDAWSNKSQSLEGACISEELFANLIKLIGDFFNDPSPGGYKVATIQDEIDATKNILHSKKLKKGKKSSQN